MDNPITSLYPRVTQGIVTFDVFILGNTTAATHGEWIVWFNGRILAVLCDVETAPTTSDEIVDVDINNTTIFTTQASRPTLTDGDTGFYTVGAIEVSTLHVGDVIRLTIDQIGSGTAATRFKATIVCEAA